MTKPNLMVDLLVNCGGAVERFFPMASEDMLVINGKETKISMVPLFWGVPKCHGAGGMAGHVRFGARKGGSLVILGGKYKV